MNKEFMLFGYFVFGVGGVMMCMTFPSAASVFGPLLIIFAMVLLHLIFK